ncbi:DUF6220 domain-containing protein [Cohnella cholangitidis]|uniref:Uncharacterized protein n=1 Tax=Cohnella cholangitidis TaxID=2598458 RepID=A0A7G5C349_9BACL|nr:DUF6220 domain-containing protein [Cohnella cholangitidis]QMV43633.1 hypothetical protein FPL14_22470 [Cohnella cholangitidis]
MDGKSIFNRAGRIIYVTLAWGFLLCILVQVVIAGMATFTDPSDWELHSAFVKGFAMVPLAMFLLTFVGKINGRNRWISLALFGLIVFQFLTVQVFSSIPAITALHPLIALLLFWGSVTTVKREKTARQ